MKKLILFMVLAVFCANAQIARFAAEITRPANATAYAAGDVVSGADSLVRLLVPAGRYLSGRIISARLSADTANTTNATFRLILLSDSIGTGKVADNAAFVNSMTLDSLVVGTIDFTLASTGNGSNSTIAYQNIVDHPMPFSSNSRLGVWQALWGRLVATGAYQPKVSGRFRIVLEIEEARR